MPYFTAALARTGRRWVARDLHVEPDEDMVDLADRMRAVAYDEEPVILILELEDEWFAIVRVDGEEDPRVFLSDTPGVASSPYTTLLGAEDLEPEEPEPVRSEDDDDDPRAEDIAAIPGGDADVLADFGLPPQRLRELCEDGATPGDTLAEVATAAGFEELLDSLR